MKVFLVEDAPLLRERLTAMFGAMPGVSAVGYASGAKEAVEKILAERPDAVVLDLHLAQGNGFDVLKGLKAAGFEPAVYVLTNHPIEAYRQNAAKLGARGFFDKSNEIHLLREEIGKLLRP